MKKRSRERQMPTEDQNEQTAPPAPQAAPKPAVEHRTCTICERPLPCPLHDKPAIDLSDEAPQSKAIIEDAPDEPRQPEPEREQPRTLQELHDRIIELRQTKPAYRPPPPTERQAEQTRLEMEAGRRATERAAAQQVFRPAQTDPTEGTNKPVFRPGDVDEYRGSFKSQVMTKSKDAR